jgi:hypothetical protein
MKWGVDWNMSEPEKQSAPETLTPEEIAFLERIPVKRLYLLMLEAMNDPLRQLVEKELLKADGASRALDAMLLARSRESRYVASPAFRRRMRAALEWRRGRLLAREAALRN